MRLFPMMLKMLQHLDWPKGDNSKTMLARPFLFSTQSTYDIRMEMGKQNSRTFPGVFQDFFLFFKESIS